MTARSDIRDVLKSTIAHYEWGTGQIYFSELAAANHLTPANVFVNLVQNVGRWTTYPEFRQTVAVMHETVHFHQDISTGVGHWDFVQRRKAFQRLLATVRYDNQTSGSLLAEPPDSRKETYLEAFSPSLYNSWGHRSKILRAELSSRLSDESDFDPNSDLPDLLSMESLLETEAVIHVYIQLSKELELSPEALQIRDDNAYLYHPRAMGNTYQGLHDLLLRSLAHHIGVSNEEELKEFEQETHLTLTDFLDIYRRLFDIAFAYPPPSYFAETGQREIDFHPGIKLMHMNRTFGLPEMEIVEDRILKECPIKYPKTTEVYERWIDYFSKDPELATDPIANIRMKLCERRRSADSFISRNLNSELAYDMPMTYSIANQTGRYVTAVNQYAKSRELELVDQRLQWDSVYSRLYKWLFLGQSFRCPFADGSCPVKTALCSSGIASSSQIPLSQDCVIRVFLEKEGLSIT